MLKAGPSVIAEASQVLIRIRLIALPPEPAARTAALRVIQTDPGREQTLCVVVDSSDSPPGIPLLVHAVSQATDAAGWSRSPALRAYCACCPQVQGLVAVLRQAQWRFARGGQRLFTHVTLLYPIESDAAIRELLDNIALQGLGYALA
ncbi:hypothetical protein [Parvibium lacunae]|uniref:Uncharacterized protein n=1 Tax=Parvibium lacunae TaxID=1888893 RepID=A0A368L0S8_9BURK|nr:hypothetical protein [Parvibium lacunae]RCS57159.1 hypothetical protein DU000_10170 [Parvibium lacunae]